MQEDTKNEVAEPHQEFVTEEQATSATHVGLWKILAGSLAIVVIGFALVYGFSSLS